MTLRSCHAAEIYPEPLDSNLREAETRYSTGADTTIRRSAGTAAREYAPN